MDDWIEDFTAAKMNELDVTCLNGYITHQIHLNKAGEKIKGYSLATLFWILKISQKDTYLNKLRDSRQEKKKLSALPLSG